MHDRVSKQRRPWDRVRAYMNGNVDAFVDLVSEHRLLLMHICRRRGRPHAEDAVDETWYQILRRIEAGDIPWHRTFSSWIGGICLNVLRSKALRTESVGSTGGPIAVAPLDEAHDPADIVARWELHDAIRCCLDKLDERLQTVYRVHYLDGQPLVRVAATLGCSEANVRQKLLPKLLNNMRICLSRKGFGFPRLTD